ncbi:hypothetical protein [Nonomuraea sp. NPDC049695]|uniref:hypothetical protein n=1 Tax=Nonomuraea sp. NPDC049695 TaxID=3154734 RepID=UPI0034365530
MRAQPDPLNSTRSTPPRSARHARPSASLPYRPPDEIPTEQFAAITYPATPEALRPAIVRVRDSATAAASAIERILYPEVVNGG